MAYKLANSNHWSNYIIFAALI